MLTQRIVRQPDLFASERDQLDLFDSAPAAEPARPGTGPDIGAERQPAYEAIGEA